MRNERRKRKAQKSELKYLPLNRMNTIDFMRQTEWQAQLTRDSPIWFDEFGNYVYRFEARSNPLWYSSPFRIVSRCGLTVVRSPTQWSIVTIVYKFIKCSRSPRPSTWQPSIRTGGVIDGTTESKRVHDSDGRACAFQPFQFDSIYLMENSYTHTIRHRPQSRPNLKHNVSLYFLLNHSQIRM